MRGLTGLEHNGRGGSSSGSKAPGCGRYGICKVGTERKAAIASKDEAMNSTGRVAPCFVWDVLPSRGSRGCSREDPMPHFALKRES